MQKIDKDFWREEDKEEQLYNYIILGLIIFHIALFFINTTMIIKINNKINDIKNTQIELKERETNK